MSASDLILPIFFAFGIVLFFVMVVRHQRTCPFCRGRAIDINDMRGKEQGAVLKELDAPNRDLPAKGEVMICDSCKAVFDCRHRVAYRPGEGGSPAGMDALSVNDIRCRNCFQIPCKHTTPSLEDKERRFVEQKMKMVEEKAPDKPAYICLSCGCVNVWEKSAGNKYHFLRARPDLGLYSEADEILRKRRRDASLKEVSLIQAQWSFEPERITATPPGVVKDPLRVCDLSGEFVIDLAERKISFGKGRRQQEFELDDTWRVKSEPYQPGLENFAPRRSALLNNSRVILFSKKHRIAFILYGGIEQNCRDFAKNVRNRLGLDSDAS